MKRRVTMFRKQSHEIVQGVAKAGQPMVYVGMQCPQAMHGGGVVSEMELVGNGTAILIRKVDDKGRPLRDFGALASGGGSTVKFEGDGMIYPISETRGAVFEDVPEAPAQPVQQPKGK